MAEFRSLWDSIATFFQNDAKYFNWPVLIWPAALILFVVFFFRAYSRDLRPRQGTLEWIGALERPRLSLLGRPHRLHKRDWLYALLLTLVYGVLAFSFSGDSAAPQTFWHAYKEQSMTVDLGREVHVDALLYYPGLGHGDLDIKDANGSVTEVVGEWTLELSADGQVWREQPVMKQRWSELFQWRAAWLEDDPALVTRYLRLTPKVDGLELGELALVTSDGAGGRCLFDFGSVRRVYPQYAALFDEQDVIPAMPDQMGQNHDKVSDQNGGMYFDEIYHARTAYEMIRGVQPTETTHPPLGKELIALGVELFGMTPFGWRFMGILFGALMVPLLYILIKNIFGHTAVAVCGTALFAFENMHYAQTHLATIDTYAVFFILAMYLFMYRYISSGYDAAFRKTLPPLFLCGLSFGLGVASKWTGFYAAAGLIVLYAAYLVLRGRHQIAAGRKKEYRIFLLQTLAASVVCFVIIPFVIYTLSYIPYTTAYGQPLTVSGLLGDMWNNQKSMLEYHSHTVLGATHPYQSRWWMWMLDIRPILYYSNYSDGARTLIGAFTNPLVTIGGLTAMCYVLFEFFRKRAKETLFIAVGYLAQLAPWMFVVRITFAYHYFPSMIFLTLALCYVFKNILERAPEHKWRIFLFTGVSVGLFLLLLPPTAGLRMPDWYSEWFVRWLPGWPF